MRLTRCFVAAELSSGLRLRLPPGPSAHIARVLRLRAGATLLLFDGRGGEYEAQILALERSGVEVSVGAHAPIDREAPVAVSLLQCLARGERMDWIVQKATELGVARLVPVASEHSVVRLDDASAQRRSLHWQGIIESACEQCGRNRLPLLRPAVDFEEACAQASDGAARLLLDPLGNVSLSAALTALPVSGPRAELSLLIGPEGGFSARERAIAEHYGFLSCQLGPRILRAETAPLAALAAIQTLLGDFSGAD
jgi:16S rRNA (uracil1498-N3)-methyltransferase